MTPQPAPQPTEQSGQSQQHIRLDIQGLRALAVILVMLFHLGLPFPGGFIGVDVFFVISGFVITAMLQREWVQTNRIDIARFFIRRFWRLTPALATVVATTLLVGASVFSVLGPQTNLTATGIGAMLISANNVIAQSTGDYFDLAAHSNALLNMWSLSVEEQFYIGFLAVLVLGWSLGKLLKHPTSTAPIVISIVFCASFTLAMLAQSEEPLDSGNWLYHFFSPLNRAWEFAAGALLALATARVEKLSTRIKTFCAIVGLLLVGYATFAISAADIWPGWLTIIPVVGAVLLLTGNSHHDSIVGRILTHRCMTYIGDRSYSLYLWHWPVIVVVQYLNLHRWAQILIAIGVCVLLSLMTYRWIEMPLRQRTFRNSISKLLWAIVIVVTPIGIGLMINSAIEHGYWNSHVRSQRQAIEARYLADVHGCKSLTSFLHRSAKDCSWNTGASGRPIYLVGDSNAAHFSDGLLKAAKQTGHPLVAATAYGCPFLTTGYSQPDRNAPEDAGYKRCPKFASDTLTWLKQQPRGLVIIANSDSYVEIPRLRVVTPGTSAHGGANHYFTLLAQTVRSLQTDGFQVAIIAGPPHFDIRAPRFPAQFDWDPAECTLWAQLRNTCMNALPLRVADQYQAHYLEGLAKVQRATNSTLIDLSRAFCTASECPTQNGQIQVYRDGRHITVDASMHLTSRFALEINTLFTRN